MRGRADEGGPDLPVLEHVQRCADFTQVRWGQHQVDELQEAGGAAVPFGHWLHIHFWGTFALVGFGLFDGAEGECWFRCAHNCIIHNPYFYFRGGRRKRPIAGTCANSITTESKPKPINFSEWWKESTWLEQELVPRRCAYVLKQKLYVLLVTSENKYKITGVQH
jgi:hypothetical protein